MIGCVGRTPGCRLEVAGFVADVVIGAEEAQAKAEIQGQSWRYAPVVLDVGLQDLVAVVVLRLRGGLGEGGDSAR